MWTWQRKGFDITNPTIPVNTKKHSTYWNHPDEQTRSHFRIVYNKLWVKLGTDQFHWYYCDENGAISDSSLVEYGTDAFLWELEIPQNKIWKIACSASWEFLRGNISFVPRGLIQSWMGRLRKENPKELSGGKLDELQKDFLEFWKQKGEDELWDLLLLKKIVPCCSQALLKHPIDKGFVVKNPLTDGRWWNRVEERCPVVKNIQPLPCLQCPGLVS